MQHRIHRRHTKARSRIFWTLAWSDEGRHAKRAENIRRCCRCPQLRLSPTEGVVLCRRRCRDRLCPLCSELRSREAAEKVVAAVEAMHEPRHLVLTAPSVDMPLADQIKALRAALRRLRASEVWKRTQVGGVYSFEVTRSSQTGLWHPHVHIVMDGVFVPHRDIRDAWRAALMGGDGWPDLDEGDPVIVHVSAIKNRRKVGQYIAKYVTKPQDLASWPDGAILEYADAMHGVRVCHTFGNLHGRELSPKRDTMDPFTSDHLIDLGQLLGQARDGHSLSRLAIRHAARGVSGFASVVGDVSDPLPDCGEDGVAESQAWLREHLPHVARCREGPARPPPKRSGFALTLFHPYGEEHRERDAAGSRLN